MTNTATAHVVVGDEVLEYASAEEANAAALDPQSGIEPIAVHPLDAVEAQALHDAANDFVTEWDRP